MPRGDVEISVLREQTSRYIQDAPTVVRFTPYPEQRTDAGGLRRAPGTPRAPQTVRLIPLDRRASGTANLVAGRPADGVMREARFGLMGEHDLEVDRGDRFTIDGTTYEVTEVQPSVSAPYLRRVFVRGVPDS